MEKQQSIVKQGQDLSDSVTGDKDGNSGEGRVRSTSSSSNPPIPSSETDIKVVKCSPEEKEKGRWLRFKKQEQVQRLKLYVKTRIGVLIPKRHT